MRLINTINDAYHFLVTSYTEMGEFKNCKPLKKHHILEREWGAIHTTDVSEPQNENDLLQPKNILFYYSVSRFICTLLVVF